MSVCISRFSNAELLQAIRFYVPNSTIMYHMNIPGEIRFYNYMYVCCVSICLLESICQPGCFEPICLPSRANLSTHSFCEIQFSNGKKKRDRNTHFANIITLRYCIIQNYEKENI